MGRQRLAKHITPHLMGGKRPLRAAADHYSAAIRLGAARGAGLNRSVRAPVSAEGGIKWVQCASGSGWTHLMGVAAPYRGFERPA
jgi:hypothetical protein